MDGRHTSTLAVRGRGRTRARLARITVDYSLHLLIACGDTCFMGGPKKPQLHDNVNQTSKQAHPGSFQHEEIPPQPQMAAKAQICRACPTDMLLPEPPKHNAARTFRCQPLESILALQKPKNNSPIWPPSLQTWTGTPFDPYGFPEAVRKLSGTEALEEGWKFH